tara:strand:- start:3530 stop:3982 length:453 start_codon:yes stop_codon:yes gene_type:complete
MATTLTAATLTVSVTEEITLNGTSYNQKVTETFASIAKFDKRIISIPASTSSTLYSFASSPAGLQFDSDELKYLRITNLDDTSQVILTTSGASAAGAQAVNPGGSYTLMGNGVNGAGSKAAITSVVALDTIYVRNGSGAAVDIEIVIATA